MATKNRKRPIAQKTIALALQGGGMHGAFTWGVLDRLLEDGRLLIEGVSATSAGAMNAAVLAHGLLTGDSEGARQALHDFWRAVAQSSPAVTPDYRVTIQCSQAFAVHRAPGRLVSAINSSAA